LKEGGNRFGCFLSDGCDGFKRVWSVWGDLKKKGSGRAPRGKV